MKKKVAIVVLLALMTSLMLGGCGGKDKGNNAADQANSQNTNSAARVVVEEEVEADPLVVALAKELLQEKAYSESELVKALGKISIKQADAKTAAKALKIDYSAEALRAAVELGAGFPANRVQALLENSGYDAKDVTFAMDNYEDDGAAALIEEELAKFELTDEEVELLAEYHAE